MTVGRCGKTSFHQMLSSSSISTAPATVGFRSRFFDLLMGHVPFEFANMSLGCGAARPQPASFTNVRIAKKHIGAPINAVGSLQPLTGRTDGGLRFSVILKIVLLKHPFLGQVLFQCRTQILHVRPNLLLLASREVFIRPVLRVGDHDSNLTFGIGFVLLHQVHQLLVLRHISSCRFDRGDDSALIVHYSMMFVAQLRRIFRMFPGQRRIRIGSTHCRPLLAAIPFIVRFIEFLGFSPLNLPQGFDQRWRAVTQ
jgi:hypothetical protein